MNWKTILAGVVTTVIISLSFQLVFVLAASFIGNAGSGSGFISTYRQELWYASAMVSHSISMAVGGATTVLLFSHSQHIRHAAIVGGLASSVFLVPLLLVGTLNLQSLVYVILGSGCAALAALAITRYCAEEPLLDQN
ncbi:hypothetical protein [Motiliproteus sp. MSK22-1]|uniref:hypothetical protein n=1 Tax=Motiliproteus sp. MSK22-1 TaxID=1897630 RepID=UPI0009778B24|nr:hypothetical protein [Motiliproteus sp. MSK22-1]OMH39049.1 hypothetical protein BGP75_04860 [Motiliproteus sp. MSK22-1]